MISNFNLRQSVKKVKEDLLEVAKKRAEVAQLLTSLGLTENQKKSIRENRKNGIDERSKLVRQRAIENMKELEAQAQELHKERIRLHEIGESERNKQLMNVFREIFSQEQLIAIKEEAERRMESEEPRQLDFSFKKLDDYKSMYYKYREISKEQLEKMIQFRLELTGLIEKGCDQFGKAEFLKFISPLNTLIIPVDELRKIKLKHHLA